MSTRKKNPSHGSDYDDGFAAGYQTGLEECGPLAGFTGVFDRRKKVKGLAGRSEAKVRAAAQAAEAEARKDVEAAKKRAKRALAELTGESAFEDNPRQRAPADETAARELMLYATNTYELVPQRQMIERALMRKVKQGKYSSKLAPVAWKHWMDAAAKRYAKEFASAREWNTIFTPATREMAAAEMSEEFEGENDIRRTNPRTSKRRAANPEDNGELVFHARTRGSRYVVKVYLVQNSKWGPSYSVKEWTGGSSSGGGGSYTKQEIQKAMARKLYFAKQIDGINYKIHKDEIGVGEMLSAATNQSNPRTKRESGPGSYPWDDCIRDQTKRYGSKKTAQRVCGSIRSKSRKKNPRRAPATYDSDKTFGGVKYGDLVEVVAKKDRSKPVFFVGRVSYDKGAGFAIQEGDYFKGASRGRALSLVPQRRGSRLHVPGSGSWDVITVKVVGREISPGRVKLLDKRYKTQLENLVSNPRTNPKRKAKKNPGTKRSSSATINSYLKGLK